MGGKKRSRRSDDYIRPARAKTFLCPLCHLRLPAPDLVEIRISPDGRSVRCEPASLARSMTRSGLPVPETLIGRERLDCFFDLSGWAREILPKLDIERTARLFELVESRLGGYIKI